MIAMLSALWAIPATWPATVAKVTVVLITAALATVALHRTSAAIRHLVWLLALASCVVIAVAAPNAPRIDVPVRGLELVGSTRAVVARAGRADRVLPIVITTPPPIVIGGQTMNIVVPAVAQDSPPRVPFRERIPFVLVLIWTAGFVYVIARARLAASRVASIVDDAHRLTSTELRSAVRDASFDVGLRREVEVFESDEITSPMTSGFLTPVVVLPMEARDWGAERRRIVLVHELAHVARSDYFAQLIATLACAIFWFHPFVWIAAARLRAEAEHAADDHVLNAGTVGVTYASHLLDLARRYRRDLTPTAAVGMVRSSQLEGRFRAMLDSSRSRAAVSGRSQAIAGSLVLSAMIPVAGLRAVAARPTVAIATQGAPAQAIAIAVDAPTLARAADSIFDKTIEASQGDRLTLDLSSGGAIVIHGWDEPRVRVVGRLGGRDWRDTRVTLQRVDGGIRLRSEMESMRERWSTAHEFELWVPRHTNVQVSSSGGSLAINDVSGDFYGHTGGGGITIQNATGSASLTTGGGEISVANSRLSGTVSTGGGELTVTNVTGGLRGTSGTGGAIVASTDGVSTVTTSGTRTNMVNGAMVETFTGIRGGSARSIGSSGGAVAISKDGGDIVIDAAPDGAVLHTGGGRIVVRSSGRSVAANTGGGDIELEDLAGDATATTGRGTVRISVSNVLRVNHSIDVQSGTGRVVIEVPADLDARIELETAYTERFDRKTSITSDFSLDHTETDRWDSNAGTPRKYVRATGIVGSGRGLIRVRTVNGDVVLRRVNP